MKYGIIILQNVKLIGIAKEMAFSKGPEECPKFWKDFFEKYIKPVIDGATPTLLQKAVFDNHIGEYAVCDCKRPVRNCSNCGEAALAECDGKFRYIIAGKYEGGNLPESMTQIELPDGEWIKFFFVGGMSAFQEQYMSVFKEWIPNHKEIVRNPDMLVEWYDGDDMTSPDFKCGIMLHIPGNE
jgi:predicted transcriptional regulator YdeE